MEIHLTIPQAWNDLSETQTENICSALYCNQKAIKNQCNPDEINTATFFIVAKELLRGNSFKSVRIALRELRLSVYNQLVDFIFKNEVTLHRFPEKLGNTNLYGPQYRLRNITIAELSYVDAIYFRWTQKKTEQYLNMLCAALYRPAKDATNKLDMREPFSRLAVDANMETVAQVPFEKRLVIAYAFEGSRNYIASQYPTVFPKRAKTETPKPDAKPPKYTPFGELIAAKIEYDPSKLDTVNSMNAYDFLNVYETELRELRKKPKK